MGKMDRNENVGEKISKLWEYYSSGIAYQKALGISEQIPQNIDFYEGRQWPKGSADTATMPRPVVNIVKMIVRNKKASVLGGSVKLNFNASRDKERSDKITRFNSYIETEMGMKELRSRFVDDAVKKGCGFMHFYWDAEACGAVGTYGGGVRAEIIDPLNIFFANPTETDEQKQKWILIASRNELTSVIGMADKNVDKALITPDDYDTKYYDSKEQDGSELVTVLTRYFKINGEVFYEKGTKKVMLHAPRALTPNFTSESNVEDAPENELPDEAERRNGTEFPQATLYPVVAYSYECREKSIYGLSEIEGIIPNQKSINFNLGMQLLSVQNQAWGKYIVRQGALREQKINNTPGQVLYDFSPSGDGIHKLVEQPFSNMPLQLIDSLTSLTRTVTGSSEVMTGEQSFASQSGAAIAQLQSQALMPVAELRDRYWRACEKGGKILEQFYKLFYEEKEFEYYEKNEYEADVFDGKEFADLDFSVNVEAGAGTQFSEALTMSLLEQLLAGQMIDFNTYVELYPDSAMPFKATLKTTLAERESEQCVQLAQQLEQTSAAVEYLKAQLEQASAAMKSQNGLVTQAAALVNQFDTLQAENAALKVEGATKILSGNKALGYSSSMAKDATNDATMLAQLLAEQKNSKQENSQPIG